MPLTCSQWGSKPKIFLGKYLGYAKMFDFWRPTEFCLGRNFSKHKITRYAKNIPLTLPNAIASYHSVGGLQQPS